jgi:hypothetical protein
MAKQLQQQHTTRPPGLAGFPCNWDTGIEDAASTKPAFNGKQQVALSDCHNGSRVHAADTTELQLLCAKPLFLLTLKALK